MISIYNSPTPLQNKSEIRGHKVQILLSEQRGRYPVDPYHLSRKTREKKIKRSGKRLHRDNRSRFFLKSVPAKGNLEIPHVVRVNQGD